MSNENLPAIYSDMNLVSLLMNQCFGLVSPEVRGEHWKAEINQTVFKKRIEQIKVTMPDGSDYTATIADVERAVEFYTATKATVIHGVDTYTVRALGYWKGPAA